MMNSQLAAALMGPSSFSTNRCFKTSNTSIGNSSSTTTTSTKSTHNEDDEMESEGIDEFVDEDLEDRASRNAANNSRLVTLQMLLASNILQPGQSLMTIEYLGQRFVGDLLPDGKIKSQETETIFCSPSAWAIHCKRIINPDKKSGCGWASVKYKGKKLDAYKAMWLRKCQQLMRDSTPTDDELEQEQAAKPAVPAVPIKRVVVKHNTVNNRMVAHDANTLIESVTFSSLGKIQPFLVSITTNAVLLMDFHCHLTTAEVCGYLAGTWDVNTHSKSDEVIVEVGDLAITHTFPCRNMKHDRDKAAQVEMEIQRNMKQRNVTLVGWYHSHAKSPAMPTLRDCDAQLEYQIKMKGPSDVSYTPCVGVICAPYYSDSPTLESSIMCYWVTPPPENRPSEYGRPMLMAYSVVQDSHLLSDTMDEMKRSVEYYKMSPELVDFKENYKGNISYVEKLKITLTSKFPRNQSDGVLWNFIKDIIGCPGDDKIDTTALLSIPVLSAPKPITSESLTVSLDSLVSISNLQAQLNIPMSLQSQITIPPGLSVSSITSLPHNMSKYDLPSSLNIPGTSINKSTVDTSMCSILSASSLAASLASFTGKLPTNSSLPSSRSANSTTASLASTIPTCLTNNLMISSSDIANALFQSGKFPSTSSLLGLPDPMSKSTLAANNMFLSPSLLKLQDTFSMLKPLSTTIPVASSSKSTEISSPRIPQELQASKYEFTHEQRPHSSLNVCKLDFPDFSLTQTNTDFSASDLSISSMKMARPEFTASDLCISSIKTPSYSNEVIKRKSDFSVAELTGVSSSKISKTDYPMLDLTVSSAGNLNFTSNIVETLANINSSIETLAQTATSQSVSFPSTPAQKYSLISVPVSVPIVCSSVASSVDTLVNIAPATVSVPNENPLDFATTHKIPTVVNQE